MAEKKRRGRREFLNDYRKDASGGYVFTGKTYAWKSPRRTALVKIWLLSAAAFAAQLLAGCLTDTGMDGRFWALLPYAAALVSAASLLWGSYVLTDGGSSLKDHVWQQSVGKLPGRGLLTAVFSGIAITGELVNLLWESQYEGTVKDALLYLALEAGSLACGMLLRRAVQRLEWEER